MDKLTTVVSYMTLIGMPTLFAMMCVCFKFLQKFFDNVKYISSAIKSQIRNDLIKDYEAYKERGHISQVELDEWLNRYYNYHNLYGDNGVLDDRKDCMIKMQVK